MTLPQGLGAWLWLPQLLGGYGPSLVSRLQRYGFSWVAPRGAVSQKSAHFRDSNWKPDTAKAATEMFHAAGIGVYPWIYNQPTQVNDELRTVADLFEEGADGVLHDAEDPYCGNLSGGKTVTTAANLLVDRSLSIANGRFLGFAPFPFLISHADFPYDAFATKMWAMSQCYWTQFPKSANDALTLTLNQWDAYRNKLLQKGTPLVGHVPIGCVYGKAELRKLGAPAAQLPPGEYKLGELETYFDATAQAPFRSVWGFEFAAPDALDDLLLLKPPDAPLGLPDLGKPIFNAMDAISSWQKDGS